MPEQDRMSANPAAKATLEQPLEKMGAAKGAKVTEVKDGVDVEMTAIQSISQAIRTFTFNLRDGDFSEQTSAVTRPSGAGFVVFVNSMDYAFVTAQGGTTLTERPLGQFHIDPGLRGDNLVCRVRLTDRNADDPVRIVVSVGVLFWRS